MLNQYIAKTHRGTSLLTKIRKSLAKQFLEIACIISYSIKTLCLSASIMYHKKCKTCICRLKKITTAASPPFSTSVKTKEL